MAAGVFVAMIGLSCHFTDLVHTAGWTGNPDSDGLARAFFLSFQKSALAVAEDEDATLTLEQGWLRDTPIWNALKGHGGDRLPPRRQLQKAWHTPLTGLYPCTTVPQDIWTPGGPVREAVAQMEFRDRAAPSHGATGD